MKDGIALRRNLRVGLILTALLGFAVVPVVGAAESINTSDTQGSSARIGVADARVVVTSEPDSSQAAEPSPEEPAQTPLPSGETPTEALEITPIPTLADQQELVKERQAEDGLLTPEAVLEREESDLAFVDLSPEESEALLADRFQVQLEQIDADPSRALSEVELEQVTSPTEALGLIDGEKVLLESTVPVRAPDGDSEAKVDLQLEETEQGLKPKNPLVRTVLPLSAQEPIQVGQIGLSLQGASSAKSRLVGDEDLYLPDAAEDTSLLLSPISGGVELSAMLLSRKSPESLRFSVAMPETARLIAAADGGAEVVDFAEKETLGRIGAPMAVDAQGTSIPIVLKVEDGAINLELRHRSIDVAYPIFIDPEIEEHWENFSDTSKLNYWQWEWSGVPNSETYIGQRSCIVTCWGNGLYVRSRSNTTYNAGSYGRWKFVPQGSTTYMRRVIFGPIDYDAHGCTANEPHPYVGVYRDNGTWAVRSNAYPSGWFNWIDSGSGDLGAGSRAAFVGIHADAAANIKCGHDYRLGGAVLYLSDPENPSVSANGYPTTWLKDKSNFTLNVPVYDPGLGAKSATVSPKDAPPLPTKELSCTGHHDSPCPANNTFQWTLSADSYDQGEKDVQVSAKDAMGKTSNTFAFTVRVDRTPPDLNLGGQLAIATKEAEGEAKDPTDFDPLHLPVYNLTIKADDGVENGTAAQRRSGVKSIEVFLDSGKSPVQSWAQGACSNSCGMTRTFTLKTNELSALTHHTLKVVVKDHAGNTPREREVEFEYVPATGMKEEYVLHHFPLPNGQGDEDSEENPVRPELAVNVMNGNLVYRQLDVDVSGPAADLEVERFYNSLLPASQDTEWGDGWTLAQTPTLEPETPEGSATEATVVEESGAVESQVDLPAKVGEERFDPTLQATIAKEASGYALTDETGETAGTVKFATDGEASELETGDYSGVEYLHEEGGLSEIAVDDIASTDLSPEEAAELEDAANSPAYAASVGAQGAGPGQFEHPVALARDPEGNLWAGDLDYLGGPSRIQKFDSEGNFLDEISTPGGGIGGSLRLSGLDTDSEGNLWITDWSNARVEVFDKDGNFIRRFGSQGSGNGQLSIPEGIAIDPDGHVWVADKGNNRLQEFTATGGFIRAVAPSGEPAQLSWPNSITAAPDGRIWVTEMNSNQVSVFDPDGAFVRRFGSEGSGPGQFNQPGGIAVDGGGRVWVGDQVNNRVQVFDEQGDFIRELGESGSGPGQLQLTYTIGLVADGQGGIWITDWGNHRVQRLRVVREKPSGHGEVQDDPAVAVESSGGLVDAVEGPDVGEVAYEHDGELLTAVSGEEGATTYEYDGNNRMTKVTLPNGTYAEIAYEATYGRVKSVTVSIEGASPKTTYFSYEDQPQRRTTVTPPAPDPVTTYEFAADGSMLKWWNTSKPPTIDDIAGTLHDVEQRETASPITPGLYNLWVQASSAEGIASIQIVANNDTLVSEKTCPQVPGPPVECPKETDEWVLETGSFAPGILYLEVIATDSRGESSSERFWVNIPYTPPPDPEADDPPKFADILRFREEFGLDLDIKGDEEAINDRIFNLIGDWNNPHTPAGEVARATADRWSIPMRLADAAEMEFRQSYIDHDSVAVSDWAESHYPGTYAGYYVDHQTGGTVHIGFTQDQAQRVADIKQQVNLVAPHSRVEAFPSVPSAPLESVDSAYEAISTALETNSALRNAIISIDVNEAQSRVEVGAPDVEQAKSLISQVVGGAAPIAIHYESGGLEPLSGRLRDSGRILAGDRVITEKAGGIGKCTSGYGAWEDRFERSDGDLVRARFLLTAGHCADLSTITARSANPGLVPSTLVEVGPVNRNAMATSAVWASDGLAIRVKGGQAPNQIYRKGIAPLSVGSPSRARKTNVLCFSGLTTDHKECGEVIGLPDYVLEGHRIFGYLVDMKADKADSGAPVWNPNTGASVGLVSARPIWNKSLTYVVPLLAMRGKSPLRAPGILKALSLPDPDKPELHVILGH